jgi:hypothetical protein
MCCTLVNDNTEFNNYEKTLKSFVQIGKRKELIWVATYLNIRAVKYNIECNNYVQYKESIANNKYVISVELKYEWVADTRKGPHYPQPMFSNTLSLLPPQGKRPYTKLINTLSKIINDFITHCKLFLTIWVPLSCNNGIQPLRNNGTRITLVQD